MLKYFLFGTYEHGSGGGVVNFSFKVVSWFENININNVVSIGGISIMKFIDLFRIKRKDGLIIEDNIVNDTELVFLKGNDYFFRSYGFDGKRRKIT